MIKYKHILINVLNMMTNCPICGKKMGDVYASDIKSSYISKLEKTCFKCTTYIDFTFKHDKIINTTFIFDNLKLEIIHDQKITYLYKREIKYLPVTKKYVEISWAEVSIIDQEFEFDIQNLKDIKSKMETMLIFS